MHNEELLDLKIEKLRKLIELADKLINTLEEERMDSIPPLMEKKFLIIDEIKRIDQNLSKDKNFSEQQRDKFRYIQEALNRLKKKEEKLLHMARAKKKNIEKKLHTIEDTLRIKDVYKIKNPQKSLFERIG